jgi:hypothetical protein
MRQVLIKASDTFVHQEVEKTKREQTEAEANAREIRLKLLQVATLSISWAYHTILTKVEPFLTNLSHLQKANASPNGRLIVH